MCIRDSLNGAGKSTLARCICGLEKKCGLLQVDGKTLDWKARLKHCYMVMQDKMCIRDSTDTVWYSGRGDSIYP